MKKGLSLFLSLVMLVSCFSIFNVSAIDVGDMIYNEESNALAATALANFVVENLPDRIDDDIDEFRKTDAWNKINLMGMTMDFLYSGGRQLSWGDLDVFYTDDNGNMIFDQNGNAILKITKDDISSAVQNVNIYLQKVFYNLYGGLNLYTVENAIKLSNVIGKMFNYDFEVLSVSNFTGLFGNETPSTNEFFDAVTRLSGFGAIVQANWISRGRSFCEPLVKLLGGDYIQFYSEYYSDGHKLASKLLEAMVQKFLSVGPVDYLLDILQVCGSAAYEYTYQAPILALFNLKFAAFSNVDRTEEELKSFSGVLRLMFCDCDPIYKTGCFAAEQEDVDHFCPLEFPVERYNTAADAEECYIYLYYYLTLCGRYRGNYNYFENMKINVLKNNKITDTDKDRLNALIDGFFLGNFQSAIDSAIIPLYSENIDSASTSFFDRVKNSMMVFLKKIADYFDYLRKLISGEIIFGQGNSPFN